MEPEEEPAKKTRRSSRKSDVDLTTLPTPVMKKSSSGTSRPSRRNSKKEDETPVEPPVIVNMELDQPEDEEEEEDEEEPTTSTHRFQPLLTTLQNSADQTGQLIVLQEVAEMLSMAMEDMFTSSQLGFLCSENFIRALVNIFTQETDDAGFGMEMGPELMVLSCRCLQNMVEANPSCVTTIINCDGVSALISKLMAIEYIDLAEQILSVLEKISADYPVALLKAGAFLPVLQYIDFFSVSVQRSAIATAANAARGLTSFTSNDASGQGARNAFGNVKDTTDIVLRLLAYSDKKIVEQSVTCLSRMIEWVAGNTALSIRELMTKDRLLPIIQLAMSVSYRKSPQYNPLVFSQLIRILGPVCRASSECAQELVLELGLLKVIRCVLMDSPQESEMNQETSLLTAVVTRPVNELLEILGLAADLLPKLPDNDFWSLKSCDDSTMTLIINEKPEVSDYVQQYTTSILPLLFNVFGASVVPSLRKKVIECVARTLWATRGSPALESTLYASRGFGKFVFDLVACHQASIITEEAESPAPRIFSRDQTETVLFLIAGLQFALLVCSTLSDKMKAWLMREGLLSELQILLGKEKVLVKAIESIPPPTGSPTKSQAPGLVALMDEVQKLEKIAIEKAGESSRSNEGDTSDTSVSSKQESKDASDRLLKGLKSFYDVLKRGDDNASNDSSTKIVVLNEVRVPEHQVAAWIVVAAKRFEQLLGSVATGAGAFHVLSDLNTLCSLLTDSNDSIPGLYNAFEGIAQNMVGLVGEDHGMTGFELQASGVLDSLLDFFGVTGPFIKSPTQWTVPLQDRVRLFTHVFLNTPNMYDGSHFVPNAFQRLVTTLQDCVYQSCLMKISSAVGSSNSNFFLSRSTDYSRGTPQFISQLSRSIRIKIQRKDETEGSDAVLGAGKALYVSIHASAAFKALEYYLKSRVMSDGSAMGQTTALDSSNSPGHFDMLEAASEDEEEIDPEIIKESESQPSTAKSDVPNKTPDSKRSHAKAAKDGNDNMRIRLFYKDVEMKSDMAILKPILTDLAEQGKRPTDIWGMSHSLTYQMVKAGESKLSSEESLDGVSELVGPVESESLYPTAIGDDTAIEGVLLKSLLLLRTLQGINRGWTRLFPSTLAPSSHAENKAAEAADYQESRSFDLMQVAALPDSSFFNNKLTAQINRQLEEPLLVVAGSLPSWTRYLVHEFSTLVPLETRLMFLRSTAFGLSRSLTRWHEELATYQAARQGSSRLSSMETGNLLPRPSRQKVRIPRTRILETMMRVMEIYAHTEPFLEFEFTDEVGTGLGPTLEFYSSVCKDICLKKGVEISVEQTPRRVYTLWRQESYSNDTIHLQAIQGLFPAPISILNTPTNEQRRSLIIFEHIGKFMARALKDGRVLDLPLNPILLEFIIKGQQTEAQTDLLSPKNLSLIKAIDEGLYTSLTYLMQYVAIKKSIECQVKSEAQRQAQILAITVKGATVEDLSLDFTLPGYENIHLTPQGDLLPVSIHNLESYIQSVIEWTLYKGVAQQIKCLRSGFASVLNLSDFACFTTEELSFLICSSQEEDWSIATLTESIRANHGYTMESRLIHSFIEMLSVLDSNERKEFLQFVTGAPRLPFGGFKGLSPLLTVVRKTASAGHKADHYLPSVMTCVQYLKVPEYSSLDVMTSQFKTAMKEGQGSFHLS